MRTSLLASALFFAAVTAVAAQGCSSSSTSSRKSTKGEACQTTNDCADGLDCVPRSSGGGICVHGEFNVAATTKECAVIDCAVPKDCCPEPPSGLPSCAQLDSDCKASGSPTSYACRQQQIYCNCDGSKYSCTNGVCQGICTTDQDCGGGTYTCQSGKCVQCTSDQQCGSVSNGYVCNTVGTCVPPCKSDTDCSSFNRCLSGKCTSTGGCQSDRECIAATKNVTATCKSATCVVPCQTDLECGNPEEYKFYSCIQNQCIYVGCQTDKECQLYLGTTSGGGSKHQQIVCRDKVTK